MEIVGGFMIMLVLLGLLFSALWLSLPVFLFRLHRRIEDSMTTLKRLEGHIISLEGKIAHLHAPARQAGTTDTISGGVDETAGR